MASISRRIKNRLKRTLRPAANKIVKAVELFGKAYPNASFIQIGANDGLVRDPLRIEIERRNWKGIMVEPVPYVFKKLANRYGKHPRVALENAAISSTSGQLPFYHLRQALPDEEVWEWYHALGSFRKEVILSHKHLIADIEDRVVEIKVPGLTFDDICAKHGFSHLDLIQIDTEGYDFEIIKTINFDHWQPRMLIYEHHHLSPEDKRAANDLLRKNGYSMFEYGLDTACLLTADEATQQSRLGRYFRSLQTA